MDIVRITHQIVFRAPALRIEDLDWVLQHLNVAMMQQMMFIKVVQIIIV